MGQCGDRYTDRDTDRYNDRYTDRYTDRYIDRCPALYCGYTVHADAGSSGVAARFACCGGYTAIVDEQIEQLPLARLHQMLLLCGTLWVLTPLGLQRAALTNITGNCRVSNTTLHRLLA